MDGTSIPSRIVLMGTSKMSLNERFSQVSFPKVRQSVASVKNYNNGNLESGYRELIVNQSPVYVGGLELQDEYDVVEDDIGATTNYVEQVRIIPRRKLAVYQNPHLDRIPIQNRISYPLWRSKFGTGFVRKTDIDRPRPFGSLRYASKNTRFIRNNMNQTLWRQNTSVSRNFRGPGGRFASNGFYRTKRSVTREELDKELEEYMKKGKHPQIDVSDLK
ncbi:unnamed protein product [Thelazia callipaeda]|uniref:FoP_duplication domain-containing protein n=1 Tax=Thelazia callipaeda TaxID=103827 RepID=A0A0N5D0M4_THECL|nr:unnamed protein product [Thelazia callipaeda]